jgi:hypothetical protein
VDFMGVRLIRNTETGEERFDRGCDNGAADPRCAEARAALDRWSARLKAALEQRRALKKKYEIDPAVIESLRALGYVDAIEPDGETPPGE